jgi:hypothetical protein
MTRYIIVAAAAFFFGWLTNGWRLNAEIASIEKERAEEGRARAEATISMNRAILRTFENAGEQSRREKERAKAENDTLRRAVRDGALRLSVPAASCVAEHSGTGDQQARAELVPAVAGSLVDIAVDGDDAVRDLNECIDKYEAVRRPHQPAKE